MYLRDLFLQLFIHTYYTILDILLYVEVTCSEKIGGPIACNRELSGQ